MARSMRLFLIRHGETVDNVAGLLAGLRDSELTNHGYQQATRLGQHFLFLGLSFTHLYSSQLQRAIQTANKIREAQVARISNDSSSQVVPEVLHLPILAEQDFGSMEGKKWRDRPTDPHITDREHHREDHNEKTILVDVESKESLALRADTFLDEHILPCLDNASLTTESCVGVVSHGIFLSTLWKRLLLRLPPQSVMLSAELQATARPSLEHLGGWSNTGYLELLFSEAESASLHKHPASTTTVGVSERNAVEERSVDAGISETAAERSDVDEDVVDQQLDSTYEHSRPHSKRICNWTSTILTINGKDHLKKLKRTGGGVGSSRHDKSQKSLETFFKRQKLG